MSLDINIAVNEELSALFRGSLSAATERRVREWYARQLAEKNLQSLPKGNPLANDAIEVFEVIDAKGLADEEGVTPDALIGIDISVADEDSNFLVSASKKNDLWKRYRETKYGNFFALLIPYPPGTIDGIPIAPPSSFLDDPRAYSFKVTRPGDSARPTDWYDLLASKKFFSISTIHYVNIFVDTSGSMDFSTIGSDLDAFIAKLKDKTGLDANIFSSATEDWITPHL